LTSGDAPAGFAVREKYPQETPDLLTLARALGGAYDADALQRMAADLEHQAGLVAERDDRALGFVAWAPARRSGVVELTWLAVAEAERRRGIATALCDAMETRLRARGAKSVETSLLAAFVVLPEVDRARRFLLARGYREVRVDVGHWGAGKDRLLLRRTV